MSREAARARRAGWLLALFATLGAGTGATQTLCGDGAGAPPLPPGAVARVGDRAISRTEHARARWSWSPRTCAMPRPPATPPTPASSSLIDEELLVQHALASGLVRSDRGARDAVLRAMLELVVARRPRARGMQPRWPPRRRRTAGRRCTENARGAEARARERALRAYLDALRAQARLELPPEALP